MSPVQPPMPATVFGGFGRRVAEPRSRPQRRLTQQRTRTRQGRPIAGRAGSSFTGPRSMGLGEPAMTFVIAQLCIGVKSGECVDVCPVDCIHPTKNEAGFAAADMLHIDPEVCIDCGACAAVCPVEAIFPDNDVPEKWKSFIAKNAELSKAAPASPAAEPAQEAPAKVEAKPKPEAPKAPPAAP